MGLKNDNLFRATMYNYIDSLIQEEKTFVEVYFFASKKFGCTKNDVQERFELFESVTKKS